MAWREFRHEYPGLINGLAEQLSLNDTTPPGTARLLEGCFIREGGSAVQCPGSSRLHTSAHPATVTAMYYRPSDTLVYVISNGRLYRSSDSPVPLGGALWTWTTLGAASDFSTSTVPAPEMIEFYDGSNDTLYIADGGKLNKHVSGTTVTLDISATPNVQYLAVFNQRLWGINGSDLTLYYSGLNNGDTLGDTNNGGGSIVVRTYESAKLIAIIPLGNSLMIFHDKGISKLTGWTQDDFNIESGLSGLSESITLADGPNNYSTQRRVCSVGNEYVCAITRQGVLGIYESGQYIELSKDLPSFVAQLRSNSISYGTHVVYDSDGDAVWLVDPAYGVTVLQRKVRTEMRPYGVWTGPHSWYLSDGVGTYPVGGDFVVTIAYPHGLLGVDASDDIVHAYKTGIGGEDVRHSLRLDEGGSSYTSDAVRITLDPYVTPEGAHAYIKHVGLRWDAGNGSVVTFYGETPGVSTTTRQVTLTADTTSDGQHLYGFGSNVSGGDRFELSILPGEPKDSGLTPFAYHGCTLYGRINHVAQRLEIE